MYLFAVCCALVVCLATQLCFFWRMSFLSLKVNSKDINGQTALHLAALRADREPGTLHCSVIEETLSFAQTLRSYAAIAAHPDCNPLLPDKHGRQLPRSEAWPSEAHSQKLSSHVCPKRRLVSFLIQDSTRRVPLAVGLGASISSMAIESSLRPSQSMSWRSAVEYAADRGLEADDWDDVPHGFSLAHKSQSTEI